MMWLVEWIETFSGTYGLIEVEGIQLTSLLLIIVFCYMTASVN